MAAHRIDETTKKICTREKVRTQWCRPHHRGEVNTRRWFCPGCRFNDNRTLSVHTTDMIQEPGP